MKINKMGGRKDWLKKKKESCLGILPFSMNRDVPSLENQKRTHICSPNKLEHEKGPAS